MIYAIHYSPNPTGQRLKHMDEHERSLWTRLRQAASLAERDAVRNELVELYLPLASRLARKRAHSTPQHVQYDDLYSAAYQALLQSIPRFDLDRGVQPGTFFSLRLSGAMRDYLRDLDTTPRLERRRLNQVERWEQTSLGRQATRDEIAQRFGFDLRPVPESLSLDTPLDEDGSCRVRHTLADGRRSARADGSTISHLLRGCTQRERLVLLLYFVEEETMAEIGQQLGLSESRVSQMLTAVLKRLRSVDFDQPRLGIRPERAVELPPRPLSALHACRLILTKPEEAVVAIDFRLSLARRHLALLNRIRRQLAA